MPVHPTRREEQETAVAASRLDNFAEGLDGIFSSEAETAIPERRLPGEALPELVLVPSPASPDDYACIVGPCKHLVGRVVWFPSKNEETTPSTHTERLLYCRALREDISGDRVFDCSWWNPGLWWRLLSCFDAKRVAPRLRLEDRTAKIETPQGVVECRSCGRMREASGIAGTVAERKAAKLLVESWCWCHDQNRVPFDGTVFSWEPDSPRQLFRPCCGAAHGLSRSNAPLVSQCGEATCREFHCESCGHVPEDSTAKVAYFWRPERRG